MKYHRRVRQIHKLIGFLVVTQLLLWMVSGLYMTAVPIDKVRGQHLIEKQAFSALTSDNCLPISELLLRYPAAQRITLLNRLDQAVYEVTINDETKFLDVASGQPLPFIAQNVAEKIATTAYRGKGRLKQANFIEDLAAVPEVKGRPIPLWQVNFDDWINTSIYISAQSAEIVAVRSDLWRVFDFLWMLHIMDYQERENFNNPLVILMSSLGLFLTLSGILMLSNGLNKKGMRSLWN